MTNLARFFRISHATLDETKRGMITSVLVGMLGTLPETLFERIGTSNDAIYIAFDMIMSNTLGFLIDVMFASETGFCSIARGNPTCSNVNISDARLPDGTVSPLMFMVRSLGGLKYLKFIITVIIDMMVSLPLYMMWSRQNPNATVWVRRIAKTVIATLTFITYVNIMRFDWAYRSVYDQRAVHDMVVIVFLVAACMTFMNSPNAEPGEEGSIIMNPRAKAIIVITAMCVIAAYQGIVSSPLFMTSIHLEGWSKAIPGLIVGIAVFGGGVSYLLSPAAKDQKQTRSKPDTTAMVTSAGITGAALAMIGAMMMYIAST